MPRDQRHFHLRHVKGLGKAHPFEAKVGGGGKKASDVANRVAHAQALLNALDFLPRIPDAGLPGLYLEIASRPNEPLKRDSLDASGLSLLRSSLQAIDGGTREMATVFATEKGVTNLRKKIEQFQFEDMPDREKDGVPVPGRPKNADLVQSLGAIAEAGLRALWRSPADRFPPDNGLAHWEIWIEPAAAEAFVASAPAYGILLGTDRITFPDDVVLIGLCTRDALALATRREGTVRALATRTVTAEFFDALPVDEQAGWVAELVARTHFLPGERSGYVTLLDTGVSLAHPLIQPALDPADRHAADLAWGLDDTKGHGTQLAGLALFGDLTTRLQDGIPLIVGHRLESVKLLPDVGTNPHHLLGAVTERAVNAVEQAAVRRRTFVMASTTGDDTPHDGAPTSWSSEVDQLACGLSGIADNRRLFLVSAGNSDSSRFGVGSYFAASDHQDNEVESPSQAWNAISVGAYTEKSVLSAGQRGAALAPFGDLSPSSRTASWNSHWPLKPDVVLEGGNWVVDELPPPLTHGDLSLLTTDHQYPMRSFAFSHDTSAATALAAKQVTELWNDYPDLWPETVRALYVASARWTQRMRSHLPANPPKGSYARLFQRYGYGVPDIMRARRSASNALTLIVEDSITPYGLSAKTGGDVHNELKLFTLPWPVSALRALGSSLVTLRVALSSFIAPNPSEVSRGSRYRYASHNLRFKLNRADESAARFMGRISAAAEFAPGPTSAEGDLWDFGSDRRDVGSLHIDQLTCKASDLARRNLLAVHPVTGWWKSKRLLADWQAVGGLPEVRYALIVEIDAEHLEVDLRAEVEVAIRNLIAADTGGAVVTI